MKHCKYPKCKTEIPENRQFCDYHNKVKKAALQKIWRDKNPGYSKKYSKQWRKKIKAMEEKFKTEKLARLAA